MRRAGLVARAPGRRGERTAGATRRSRRLWGLIALSLAALALIVLFPAEALAHTPHVDVARMQIEGVLGERSWFFTVVRENLWLSGHGTSAWRRLWLGLPYARVRDIGLAADFPANGRAVAATDAGLHVSDDHGATWRPARVPPGLWPAPAELLLTLGRSPETRLCAAADSPEMICLVDRTALLSADAGESWRVLETTGRATAAYGRRGAWWLGFEDGCVGRLDREGRWTGPWRLGAAVTAMTASADGAQVFAATDGAGVWRISLAGGAAQIGLGGLRVTCLAPFGAGPGGSGGGLAATTWREGVYVCGLDDMTWSLRQRGLTREAQADQEPYCAPHFRQIAAARTRGGKEELFVAGFDGLFRSSDFGRRWRSEPTGVTTEIVAGLAEGETGGSVAVSYYGGGVRRLAVADGAVVSGPARLEGVRTFAVARAPRRDGGSETWVAGHDFIYALGADGGLVRQAPLGIGEVVKVSPLLKLRQGLLRPVKRAVAGLPAGLRDAIRAAVVTRGGVPGLKIRVPGFGSQISVPGDFVEAGVAFVSTWRHGVFRTDDHGRSFARIWAPAGGAAVHDVAASAETGGRRVVLAATEKGLWASEDGGRAWRPTAVPASTLRVATAPGPEGRPVVLVSTWTELLRCAGDVTDPRAWSKVADTPQGHAVIEIALSPDFAESGIALVNVAGRGLLRATDGGVAFAPCRSSDDEPPEAGQLVSFPDGARTIVFSPRFAEDGVVWAAAGIAVRRSEDRGLTWRRVASDETPAESLRSAAGAGHA